MSNKVNKLELKEFAKEVASRINGFMESYINKFDDDAPELKAKAGKNLTMRQLQ